MGVRRVIAVVIGILAVSLASTAAAATTEDETWMAPAHQSNLVEIAAGNSALKRANTDTVREIAQILVAHQTDLDVDLTAAAAELSLMLPDTRTAEHQAALQRVEANANDAYDAAWVAGQIAGHQAALGAARTEVESGTDPTVVQLATAAAAVIEQHLAALQDVTDEPSLAQTGDAGLFAETATSSPWPWVFVGTGVMVLAVAAIVAIGVPPAGMNPAGLGRTRPAARGHVGAFALLAVSGAVLVAGGLALAADTRLGADAPNRESCH